MAKQLAKLLEPLKPMFIEEPLLPTQPEEIADLSRMVSTPIALGERLHTRSDFRPYLERRAIDIAQPDVSVQMFYSCTTELTVWCQVSHCGGISELFRIASLTETYDVALAPHCPIGPIALAACIQVDLAVPNCMSIYTAFASLTTQFFRSHYPRDELAGELRILFKHTDDVADALV